jgi:hypothetical protein
VNIGIEAIRAYLAYTGDLEFVRDDLLSRSRSPRCTRRSALARLSVVFSYVPQSDSHACDKGTITDAFRHHFVPSDVRRHRLISISYISLLPCHCNVLVHTIDQSTDFRGGSFQPLAHLSASDDTASA